MRLFKSLFVVLFLFCACCVYSQNSLRLDPSYPEELEIRNVKVRGADGLDPDILILLSELKIGDRIRIPGERVTKAMKKLWDQGLFEDIKIKVDNIEGGYTDIIIEVKKRAKLSKFSFLGLKKTEIDDLKKEIGLVRGKVVTDQLKVRIVNIIENHFQEKGFNNPTVDVVARNDSAGSAIALTIKVNRGIKPKIEQINFTGNTVVSDKKLKRLLKETKERKWWRFYKASKYIENEFKGDKLAIVSHYNSLGYRDMKIQKDSIFYLPEGDLGVSIRISEGRKYFIRNIEFEGNSKYEDSTLHAILGMRSGSVYNQSLLDQQLFASPSGLDLSSLYMDNGYLFFQVTPVEKAIVGDSIDLVIRIYEGNQATINKIIISGNQKTNEHVIRRELWVIPGQKFSRSDIIQSQRAIANLGYFNPETMQINPIPHPENGTVDVEFKLEEKSTDQVELSAGFGSGQLIGTLGLSFNNFSTRNFFKKGGWRPVPHGDGQKLSIRGSTTGPRFQSYTASFTEPWLGGKRANSLSISAFNTVMSNIRTAQEEAIFGASADTVQRRMGILGFTLQLGNKLKWPDNDFTLITGLEYQRYNMQDWTQLTGTLFDVSNGFFNSIALSEKITRRDIDQPMFPRRGSELSITLKATPPLSIFTEKNYTDLSPEEKYKWIEYYKLKFDSEWYTPLDKKKNLVLKSRFSAGYLGFYNSQIGDSPFERFQFGGNPVLTGGQLGSFYLGFDPVSLRIFQPGEISTSNSYSVFNKYSFDLRYLLSGQNPMSTIYTHLFYEAGNAWQDIRRFNSNELQHAVGAGVRIYLPMLGLIGFDVGLKLGPEFKGNRVGTFFTIGVDPY